MKRHLLGAYRETHPKLHDNHRQDGGEIVTSTDTLKRLQYIIRRNRPPLRQLHRLCRLLQAILELLGLLQPSLPAPPRCKRIRPSLVLYCGV
jgi:hypothetical protein